MAFNQSTLHVSVPLTDLANAFRADLNGYLWSTILPPKIVRKRTDLIRQINKGQLLRSYDLRTGSGGRVQEVQFKMDPSQNFNCIDYGVQAILRNTERMEADDILEYDQEQLYHCLVAMHTGMELVALRDTLRSTSVLTNNVTLIEPEQWDNYTSGQSDPVDDLKVGILRVLTLTGHMPNVIIMHALVWDRVQRHPLVLMRGGVHPTGNAIVTLNQFEDILGVPHGTIKVTAQQWNGAREDQTPVYYSMIGPDVIIAYTSAPSVRDYSLGNSFMFQDASAGGDPQIVKEIEAPFLVYEFPDNGLYDPRGATVCRLVGGIDQKVRNTDAGYLIKNVCDYTNTTRYSNFLVP